MCSSDLCPQSLGLTQLKWKYHKIAYPMAAQSNPYLLDYSFAVWRSCFEGYETRLAADGYGAGDMWACIGWWNSGEWNDARSRSYVGRIKGFITARTWEQDRFRLTRLQAESATHRQ